MNRVSVMNLDPFDRDNCCKIEDTIRRRGSAVSNPRHRRWWVYGGGGRGGGGVCVKSETPVTRETSGTDTKDGVIEVMDRPTDRPLFVSSL